jgi:hypothetical protein
MADVSNEVEAAFEKYWQTQINEPPVDPREDARKDYLAGYALGLSARLGHLPDSAP